MVQNGLGRTLIIANPAAHSGEGESAALFATRFFSSFHSETSSCEIRLTESAGDAVRMSSRATDYDSTVALGGDGLIHEVANGIMRMPEELRPRLGIIPMGSGNDFARTIGMTANNIEQSIYELLRGEERYIDLGKVNETYFVETLSFGTDAAIAIDTTERRKNHTRQKGSALYATSGIKLIVCGRKGWEYKANIDGEEVEGTDIVFAVQNGPTYGGGFRITPDAIPDDGYLDMCYTQSRAALPHALLLFGLARVGKHTNSRSLTIRRARHAELEFVGEEAAPCQVDGEEYSANRYVIDVVPQALRVIVPEGCTWQGRLHGRQNTYA